MSTGPLSLLEELFKLGAERVAATLIIKLPSLESAFAAFQPKFPSYGAAHLRTVFNFAVQMVHAAGVIQDIAAGSPINADLIPINEYVKGFGKSQERFAVDVVVTSRTTGQSQRLRTYITDISTKRRLEGEIADFVIRFIVSDQDVTEAQGTELAKGYGYSYSFVERAW